jgi:hypothetical protein
MRTVTLHDVDANTLLAEIKTNVSPATLIPHFDVDTKLLFLTGKVMCRRVCALCRVKRSSLQGDTNIFAYEYVKSEAPYLFAVAPSSCGSSHQVSNK